LIELSTRHRERLRRKIRLRLDRRLRGRTDSSDVLQNAYLEVFRGATGVHFPRAHRQRSSHE
jgi:DNA-directed RNA polymerase specialized sigma24 family protein